MTHIVLFAGTTEGRRLAEMLADRPLDATVCVATEYGGEVLDGLPERFRVLVGRLDGEAMRELFRYKDCDLVIDATHPYAAAASRNIRAAAAAEGRRCLRLLRAASPAADAEYVDSVADAARLLAGGEGNILLATGAKELAHFASVPGLAERCFPRVLPTPESVAACRDLGFPVGHIVAMQGPFGVELNLALFRQFGIDVLVTKDGGAAGGFPEKMEAAREAGVRVVVVGRPPERDGLDLDAAYAAVVAMLEAGSCG